MKNYFFKEFFSNFRRTKKTAVEPPLDKQENSKITGKNKVETGIFSACKSYNNTDAKKKFMTESIFRQEKIYGILIFESFHLKV